jgi:hypothetical protein
MENVVMTYLKKLFGSVQKKLSASLLAMAALVFGSLPASAALPESVETAVTAVTADVTEAGGLMIGIVLAVLAIRKVISMLR